MKAALSLLAVAGLTFVMAFGASASAHPQPVGKVTLHGMIRHLAPLRVPGFSEHRIAMQTGGTGTPTPLPSPTATTSTYPDPVNLLNVAIQKLQAVNTLKFTSVETGEQTNYEKFSVSAAGAASCKADYVHVQGSDQIIGVGKTKKINYWFEQTKKTFFKKQVVNDKTNHKWQKVNQKAIYPFGDSGLSIDNPLPCFVPSSSSGGGSGSGGGGLPLLNNIGPITYAGTSAWQLQAIDDTPDSQGNAQHVEINYFVSQNTTVLLGIKVVGTSPSFNVTESFEEKFSNLGKKVTIPTIKSGSTKP